MASPARWVLSAVVAWIAIPLPLPTDMTRLYRRGDQAAAPEHGPGRVLTHHNRYRRIRPGTCATGPGRQQLQPRSPTWQWHGYGPQKPSHTDTKLGPLWAHGS